MILPVYNVLHTTPRATACSEQERYRNDTVTLHIQQVLPTPLDKNVSMYISDIKMYSV